MIVLTGGDLVLPDRMLPSGTLVVDRGRIVEIRSGPSAAPAGPSPRFAFHDHYVVPGFIDVHMHGVDGVDVLGSPDAVSAVARKLPRYGVTAFCPTSVACGPDTLGRMLAQVRALRATPPGDSARVLPAHLESNFINPAYRGAQPAECLRKPRDAFAAPRANAADGADHEFTGADVLREIDQGAPDIGIVTIAPELEGGPDLVRWLTSRGHRVSLGHSAATFEQAREAIALGARQATHLFNRMPPFNHREPGLAGAVLQADEVAAELICDGVHIHPAVVRTAVAAKGTSRILAITDSTAAAGLPAGSQARLGGQQITAGKSAAYLDDGTLAGSTATMDRVLQVLVGAVRLSFLDAVTMCATTPARELGLVGYGVLAVGAEADLVVLDRRLSVVQTYVGGRLVYSRQTEDLKVAREKD